MRVYIIALLTSTPILTLRARGAGGSVIEKLPWEILESICDSSDDIDPEYEELARQVADRHFSSHPVPQAGHEAGLASTNTPSESNTWTVIPLKKLQKNKLILSMTHVCQSWRVNLIGLKRLWRDIAFTATTTPSGVHLATLFLTRVQDSAIPLCIYAGFPFGNLPDPTIVTLLTRLRQHTHRWETFVYCGRLNPYRPYLDLPAQQLQYFSDHHDLSHLYLGQTAQLFAGHTPILRSLVTSSLRSWRSTALTNLRALDLWDCNAGLSIKSLIDVLRCAPQLEEISIVSPNSPLHNSPAIEAVDLSNLKALKVKNPDFCAIIGHLSVPNVRTTTVSSVCGRGTPGVQVGPVFEALHPFVGLTSMRLPLPMLSRPVVLASLAVDYTPSGFAFSISIATEKSTALHVDLEWVGGVSVYGQVGYIQRSMSALAEMHFLSGALLQITVPAHGFSINFNNPLFRLKTIERLTIEGEKIPTLLRVLAGGPGQRLPNLKFLAIPQEEGLSEKTIRSIPKFLRLRKNLVMAFSIENHGNLVRQLNRVCVVEGELTNLR